MLQVVVALSIIVVVALGAEVVRRRRAVDAPTQPRYELPTQLDRADFEAARSSWAVVVFTSATCSTCADVVSKAMVLNGPDVSAIDISFQEHPEIHRRYSIEAVPSTVIAGPDGVVTACFLGPVSATDLWAAVAESREPGSVNTDGSGCDRHEA